MIVLSPLVKSSHGHHRVMPWVSRAWCCHLKTQPPAPSNSIVSFDLLPHFTQIQCLIWVSGDTCTLHVHYIYKSCRTSASLPLALPKLNTAHLTLQRCAMSIWVNRWVQVFRGDSNKPNKCTSTRYEESKLIKVMYSAVGIADTSIPNPTLL